MAAWDDKVVWITGGGSGLGRALALKLSEQGARLAISGRRQERLEEVVRGIEAMGRQALAVPCDVTDEDRVEEAVQTVVQSYGRLDVAVANAGFSVAGRVAELSADDWRRQLEVNVIGLCNTARSAIPHLERHGGQVVLIGSVAAYVSAPGTAPYSASKAAVRAIGDALYLELRPRGVACTTIHPGFVESEIAQVDNQGNFRPDYEDRRPRQLMWRTEDAAEVMARAIRRRRRQFVFTGHGRLGVALARFSPGLLAALLARVRG